MGSTGNYSSNAEWYRRHDSEEERFYNIFFGFCRKYNIRWASADEKERAFIEEVTHVTYEHHKAIRLEELLPEVLSFFVG